MTQPLIILHGWGQSRDNWKEIEEKLKQKDITVVILDLPGFGSEPLISNEWGVPEYADWVKNKIESLQFKNVILLGHSFGGRIASFIASKNPKWLDKLILYGAPCIYRPSLTICFKILIAKILKKFGLKGKYKNQELEDADKSGLGEIFRKVVPFDQSQELKKINTKTYLIWGERDNSVPVRIAIEMQSLIPNSELTILNNLGHNAHLENANLFAGKLTQIFFL